MSIAALVNLKSREGVPAWTCFAAYPDRFNAFFSRVLDLPADGAGAAGSRYEARAIWTAFLVNAFAALEDSMVRAQALRLASLPMWTTLAPAHLASQVRP